MKLLRDDLGHGDRMRDKGRAVLALLLAVVLPCVMVCRIDLGKVCAGIVTADGFHQTGITLVNGQRIRFTHGFHLDSCDQALRRGR